jgi:hypothetical protein
MALDHAIWIKIFDNGNGGHYFFIFIFFISAGIARRRWSCDAMPLITVICGDDVIANW